MISGYIRTIEIFTQLHTLIMDAYCIRLQYYKNHIRYELIPYPYWIIEILIRWLFTGDDGLFLRWIFLWMPNVIIIHGKSFVNGIWFMKSWKVHPPQKTYCLISSLAWQHTYVYIYIYITMGKPYQCILLNPLNQLKYCLVCIIHTDAVISVLPWC